jgi:magnesium chelatase family protein
LNNDNPIITKRPFRAVHHTASSIAIVGWWRNAKPWEISLAHKWVLFLDEVLELKLNFFRCKNFFNVKFSFGS